MLQCGMTGAVSYTYENTTQLTLKIPLEAASNHKEVEEYKARELQRSDLAATDADAYIGAGVRSPPCSLLSWTSLDPRRRAAATWLA